MKSLRLLIKIVLSAFALALGMVIVGNLVTPDIDVDAVAFARERMPDLRLES